MKTIILLFLSYAISITGFGQNSIDKYFNNETLIKYLDKDRYSHLVLEGFPVIQQLEKYPFQFVKAHMDTKQCLDSLITRAYVTIADEWVLYSKTEYIYYNNGSLKYYVRYQWDENLSVWYPSYRLEYFYDANWRNVTTYFHHWNDSLALWDIYSRNVHTYDNNGFINSIISSYWDEELYQWVPSNKSEYINNANGNINTSIDFTWEQEMNDWKAYYRWEYSYDANENLIFKMWFITNINNSQWYEFRKSEYTLNSNNKTILENVYELNLSSGEWDPFEKKEFIYDNRNNPIQEVFYDWDGNNSLWLENYKNDYSYDYNFELPELLLPPLGMFYPFFSEEISNMPTEYINYTFLPSTWYLTRKGTYYYSEINMGITELSDFNIIIYPNPATNKLTFSVERNIIDELTIYTITGQQVYVTRPEGKTIDISSLQPGIYIVEATMDNMKIRQKLIVQR